MCFVFSVFSVLSALISDDKIIMEKWIELREFLMLSFWILIKSAMKRKLSELNQFELFKDTICNLWKPQPSK